MRLYLKQGSRLRRGADNKSTACLTHYQAFEAIDRSIPMFEFEYLSGTP